MATTISKTHRISGSGGGPTVEELFQFMSDLPSDIDPSAQVFISMTPRDRPFDSDGWQLTVHYTPSQPTTPTRPAQQPRRAEPVQPVG